MDIGEYYKIEYPGIYRYHRSGLVTIWDVRLKTPNRGQYLSPAQMHTIEHTMLDYLRKRYGRYRVLGVFPMGCQTGFYVLTRFIDKHMIYDSIVDYILELQKVINVSGVDSSQCGQHLLQDLKGAKLALLDFYGRYLKFQRSALHYEFIRRIT